MSEIQQFYAGKSIFMTGGTGFIGKVLLEKLVRSCREIEKIYILVRTKKGKDAHERVQAMLSDPVFDVVRKEYPEFAGKLVGIVGDVGAEHLGISSSDRARIVNEVSVIFHVAATVRFDEQLDVAVAVNVNSVKYIIDIAKDCKNLEVAVYVSTAFSNCVGEKIYEDMYSPPMHYNDINNFIKISERSHWSEATKEDISHKILEKWPNTYTFTKAIAEGTVDEYAKDLPIAVFRPSIVQTTVKEPFPGWIENMMGLSGAIAGVGIGVVHTMQLDGSKKVDIVPADLTCNALIACAWQTAVTKRRHSERIPVYNYVSGADRPLTWSEFIDMSFILGRELPTIKAVYYHTFLPVKSKIVFLILEFFFHCLPALLLDAVLVILGKKPFIHKIFLKGANVSRTLTFFTTRDWTFRNQRVQNLWGQLNHVDKEIFPFNLSNFDWREYLKICLMGTRRHLLHEPDHTVDQAKKRQYILYAIHVVVRLVVASLLLWIIWKIAFAG